MKYQENVCFCHVFVKRVEKPSIYPASFPESCMQNNHRTTTLSPSSQKHMVLRTLSVSWVVSLNWLTKSNRKKKQCTGMSCHLRYSPSAQQCNCPIFPGKGSQACDLCHMGYTLSDGMCESHCNMGQYPVLQVTTNTHYSPLTISVLYNVLHVSHTCQAWHTPWCLWVTNKVAYVLMSIQKWVQC